MVSPDMNFKIAYKLWELSETILVNHFQQSPNDMNIRLDSNLYKNCVLTDFNYKLSCNV